jgi:hypothetical protein
MVRMDIFTVYGKVKPNIASIRDLKLGSVQAYHHSSDYTAVVAYDTYIRLA